METSVPLWEDWGEGDVRREKVSTVHCHRRGREQVLTGLAFNCTD